jgi:hypothetical protein
VTVVEVVPPTARRTNLNNTDIFSHGEIEYDLYCDVDGRPTPELNWFKVRNKSIRVLVDIQYRLCNCTVLYIQYIYM